MNASADDSQEAVAFDSAADLQAAHAALLEMLDDALTECAGDEDAALRAIRQPVEAFVARGAATGAVLEELRERTAAQVLLHYWAGGLSRAGIDRPPSRLAIFNAAALPLLPEDSCPYVGLESFRDARHFFGREHETAALVELIARTPLAVVTGGSGSGKSSLVLGGALPALRDAGGWRIAPPWTPGDAAPQHLATAVAALAPGFDVAALRADPGAAALALGVEPPAVVAVDQFEELFTLASEADRDIVVAAIAALAGAGHRVVLTMREDFRSRMVQLEPLAPWLAAAWFSVQPMGYEALRAAVEGPALAANLRIHPDVVDDLVKKVLGQPAALPLLQFTLLELWRRRDRNRITKAVYAGVGDPLRALERLANEFVDAQAPQSQQEIQRVLLELVRVDDLLEAYRQPVRRRALLDAGRANTAEVLELLQTSQFIRISEDGAGGDAVVEIRHEALIRNWQRLGAWIDAKRLARRQRLALVQAAQRWVEAGRPDTGLLTGWQLQDARSRLDELGPTERELVAASERALTRAEDDLRRLVRRERSLRWRTVAALVFVGIVAIGGFAFLARENNRLGDERADLDARNLALERERDDLNQRLANALREIEPIVAERDRLNAQVGDLLALRLKSELGSKTGGDAAPVRLYVQIADESQRQRAETLVRQLGANGIVAPGIERVKVKLASTQVRYFHDEDAPAAASVVRIVEQTLGIRDVRALRFYGFEEKVPRNQYELWFASDAFALAEPASAPAPASPQASAPRPAPTATAPQVEPKPAEPAATPAAASAVPAAPVAKPAASAPPATPAPSRWSPTDRARLLVYRLDNGRPAPRIEDARNQHPVSWAWAKGRADSANIRTPLGLAVLYDTSAAHGAPQASTMRARKGPSAGDLASEKAWLLDFLARREALAETAQRPQLEAGRIAELRRLIGAGEWELAAEAPASTR